MRIFCLLLLVGRALPRALFPICFCYMYVLFLTQYVSFYVLSMLFVVRILGICSDFCGIARLRLGIGSASRGVVRLAEEFVTIRAAFSPRDSLRFSRHRAFRLGIHIDSRGITRLAL